LDLAGSFRTNPSILAAWFAGHARSERFFCREGTPPISVRVVRLGTQRHPEEGTRIGTVRRPPRGVPKAEFSARNWYDVWFPNLAPSPETMKLGQAAASPAQRSAFRRKYKAEMAAPGALLPASWPSRTCRVELVFGSEHQGDARSCPLVFRL